MKLAVSEADFQAVIRDLCLRRHLGCYHTARSDGSDQGFPDLVIVGEDHVLWRELKREDGKVTEPQRWWLDRLVQAGQDAAVWRPSQLSTDVVPSIMAMRPLIVWPPPKNPPRRKGYRS